MPTRKPQIVRPLRPKPAGPVHPFDRARGTDTGGLIPSAKLATGQANDRHITAYYGVAPSMLHSLLDLWLQRTAAPFSIERYTFLDIGAGKGRAVLVAAEYPFREVIGVELNPALAAIAQQNLDRVQAGVGSEGKPDLLAPVRVVQQDALTLCLPETPTVAFLFHPFEAPVLRGFLRRIETQFASRAGELDLLYVNAEHANVVERNPAFKTLWNGSVAMSTQDHIADLLEIAGQKEYGSTGDEICAIYRYIGRSPENV